MASSDYAGDLWLKLDAKILVVCMLLLSTAAGWLILTRPVHHIEGDFLQREDVGVVDEWLLEQLSNPIAEQRARAYLSLARVEGLAAIERLIKALDDAAPSVRAQAAFGIGHVLDARGPNGGHRVAEAEQALLGVLHDDERRVASNAVEALGKIQASDLAEQITQTAAPIVVTMTALIRMGASEQSDFIAQYLESDDQDSRWAAALAVAELDLEPSTVISERLVKLLKDPNEFVRAAALRAVVSETPSPGLIEAVASSAEHRDAKVRYEAERALAALSGAETPALPSGEPRLRAQADAGGAQPLFERDEYQPIVRTLGVALEIETSIGVFEVELDYEHAPLTAEYFRRQVAAGALDGTRFVTVAGNGYAVAGSRLGSIRSEINSRPFLRGSMGMLRAGDVSFPGEFFFCLTALPLADSRYVNFGRLVSGDRLLDQISDETIIQTMRQIR